MLVAERALWVGLLVPLFFGGYFAIGAGVDPESARTLHTRWDDAIPFVPETIFVYVVVYTALMLPLFTVRCPRLFRRVGFAYAATTALALLCFAVLPVTSAALRPDLRAIAPGGFALWGVKLLYHLDRPVNLFPSAHLAIATLAALGSWEARRLYGAAALAFAGVVAISVCTLKQHYIVDGLAGIALAVVAWAVLIRPARGSFASRAAWGWRGPGAYLAFLAAGYTAAWGLYRAGFAPWE